ncbi:MAG: AAA family ATPase, partial [Gammaproteobacteria bacterium]|nr:AAA family ATPase [Gammaproteobacteria bacterium]
EYAVKMRQFPQSAQLDRMLERGELHGQHMDALALMVAEFHAGIPQAKVDSPYGSPAQIFQPVIDTLNNTRQYLHDAESLRLIDQLDAWCQQGFIELKDVIAQRKADGYVRECHGDMHLRNLAWLDDAPLAFDCIEFNPNLSWNDMISEVAFLIMDLDERQQPQLAMRFLNSYLQQSGDYAGVRVLRFYLVYRAVVRAMVDAIRLGQQGITDSERVAATQESLAYLQLARSYTFVHNPLLILTRGMSGSGKSTLTQPLLEQLGAIRIRSDVERKRLYGLSAQQDGHEAYGQGIYSAEATECTYHKLAELAAEVLDGGYTTIIDATFKDAQQRQLFYRLAKEKNVTVVVLQLTASSDSLRQRIQVRKGDVSDADLEILERQIANWPLMGATEPAVVMTIDTDTGLELERLVEQIQSYVDK